MCIATAADASDLMEGRASPAPAKVSHNAHEKPAAIPSSVELERIAALRHEEDLVQAPGEAPRFEWEAIEAFHTRHSRDISLDSGPGLGLGRRLDRLIGPAEHTFALFASGLHQSGAPNPVN